MERGNACKSCLLEIVDGQAYKLGQDQWHVTCFSCSKCQKALGVNSNFLVLGTGALVCSDCSYTCKSCSKKIYDLAILTGDQAYCSDCFKCKSCKKPIDDLKYARTSKGLFCMPCHHMLMEKKKKYEMMKLKRDVKKVVEASSTDNLKSQSDPNKNSNDSSEVNTPKLEDSTTSSVDPTSFTTQNNNSSSLSTFDINDYANDKSRMSSYGSSLLTGDQLEDEDPLSNETPKLIQNSNNTDFSTPRDIVPNTPKASTEQQFLPSRSPLRTTMTPVTKSTSQYRTPELSTPVKKDLKSSQFYRTGYVLEETINKDLDNAVKPEPEPESFINLDDETEEESLMDTTLMSPINSENKIGVVMNEHESSSDDHLTTTNNFKFGGDLSNKENSQVETTPKQQQQGQFQQQTPNHQRTVSATDTIVEKKFGLGRSLTKVFKTRKSSTGPDETPLHSRTRSDHSTSHFRTVSDHSFHSNIISPLLRNDSQFSNQHQHNRSISDTNHLNQQQQQFQESELTNLKFEINSLTGTKASILKEVQNLQLLKKQLESDINERERRLKDLDSLISKHSFNSVNQSVDSLVKNDHVSIVSSQGAGTSSYDDESLEHQFVQPNIQPGVSSKKTGSGSGSGGFMRRFFGGSNSAGVNQGQNSNGTISQPMNLVHGDDAIKAMKNSISYHENLSQQGIPSQIKSSRSTNFLKIGNNIPNKELRMYTMTIQELSNSENRSIPFIIETCINEVKEKGLKQEGIYRISASTSNVEKLEQYFDKMNLNDATSLNSILETDINAISGLLKRYLKRIPDSLIPANEYNLFLSIGNVKSEKVKINMLKDMIDRVPKSNKLVMYLLVNHLNEVCLNEQWNKMNLKSLATVFAPTLVRDESLNPHQEIKDNKLKTEVMEFLFVKYKFIFQGIV